MKEFQNGQESEILNYSPVVIGIIHKRENIKTTLDFLGNFDLKNRRVMLEVCHYPIPEKYRIANLEFCEFFDAVTRKVICGGGIILAGDNEELLITQRKNWKDCGERVSRAISAVTMKS